MLDQQRLDAVDIWEHFDVTGAVVEWTRWPVRQQWIDHQRGHWQWSSRLRFRESREHNNRDTPTIGVHVCCICASTYADTDPNASADVDSNVYTYPNRNGHANAYAHANLECGGYPYANLNLTATPTPTGSGSPTPTPTITPMVIGASGVITSGLVTQLPVVDGDLFDWVLSDGVVLNCHTAEYIHMRAVPEPQDNSARVWSLWTNDMLYLAARVWDNAMVADSSDIWRDDSIEFAIDGAGDFASNGPDDHVITVAIDGRVTDLGLPPPPPPFPQVERAIRLLGDGYTVELAVPTSLLQPPVWELDHIAGFTIGLHDDDDGGDWDSYMIWVGDSVNTQPQNYGRLLLSNEPGCHYADVQPNPLHGNPSICDGDVDIVDVQRLTSCWMRPFSTTCPPSLDLNGWGSIDVFDIITSTEMWNWRRAD